MGISRVIKAAALAGLASLALLIPVGSAHGATLYGHNFCVVDGFGGPNGNTGATLQPGQRCTFFPLPTKSAWAWFHAVRNGSYSGCILIMITNNNTPINDYGQADPHAYSCWPASYLNNANNLGFLFREVNNPNDNIQGFSWFDAVYGQATIVNFSNATVKFLDVNPGNCAASGGTRGSWQNCVYYYR